MGRVIQQNSIGTQRTRLSKSIVVAIRELMRKTQPDTESRDLAAYIALALEAITATIETSVTAWEKRGYWVKADRFRLEWMWSEQLGAQLRNALLAEDWATIAKVVVQVADRLRTVEVSDKHRLGTPWIGAFKQLKTGS